MSEWWERELDEPRLTAVCTCQNCGCELYAGDEAYKVDDNMWFCVDCCGLSEIEIPERDYDFERKARLEADNGYF